MHIISCVGQRALAVVSPINTFLQTPRAEKEGNEITLLYTNDRIYSIGSACAEWFQQRFPAITVSLRRFEQAGPFIEGMASGGEPIIYNTNPGMNWEVARMGLSLPPSTRCLYADTSNLYVWHLREDIRKCEQYSLQPIGLESYNKLAQDVFVETIDEPKITLHPLLNKVLADEGLCKSYRIIKKDTSEDILNDMDRRLVWVREDKGHLYLLFDFFGNGQTTQDLTREFRIVTTILDPVNFFVTVVTDNKYLAQRARIEGIENIQVTGDSWAKKTKDWISGKLRLRPKKVIPSTLTLSGKADKTDGTDPGHVCPKRLFVCLGDNIETTLKAICSHGPDETIMFYDSTSRAISYLAERINAVFPERVIPVGTDHKGTGVFDRVLDMLETTEEAAFNITAGVKAESIALASAARLKGMEDRVFSIDGTQIRKIYDSEALVPVKMPQVGDLIACHIAPLKGRTRPIPGEELWLSLLHGLADGSLASSGYILDIKDRKKQRVCDDTGKRVPGGRIVSFKKKPLVEYPVADAIFDRTQGGLWWEAVVARALFDAFLKDVYWGVAWDWVEVHRKDWFFTELDVVFRHENHIGLVSCKTSRSEPLYEAVYLVKSEAQKRFSRFALPFLAVPYEKQEGAFIGDKIIDGVKILTPQILTDSGRLERSIQDLINSVRRYHGSGIAPH